MLRHLKAALVAFRETSAELVPSSDPVRLACAALLTKAGRLDGRLDEAEEAVMLRAMVDRFSLDQATARAVLEEGGDDLETSSDIYRYTKVLREAFNENERIELLEMLWEVTYVDGTLHEFEAQLMRRLAGLLYVDDRESGAARKRAMIKLGLAG